MNIHVVQPGDTMNSIADTYGVSAERLLQDNNVFNPNNLVPGQTVVIAYPEKTYTIQEGDTLNAIAESNGVSLMQLLRNNPYLSDREYIYPGETIVISYPVGRKIETNGFSMSYINQDILRKTLPYMTYLTIFNYSATREGGLITYGEDAGMIQTAREYGTVPLVMVTTLAIRGEPDIETAYEILLNEQKQDIHINNILNVIKSKGYGGANIVFYYLNTTTQQLYLNFSKKMSSRLKNEGYLFFITINLNLSMNQNENVIEKVDYSIFNDYVDKITFMNFIWGVNYGPPVPISSDYIMKNFLDYATPLVPADMICIGTPIIGYDWELPYQAGRSRANSLTENAAISLAHDVSAVIQFDDKSQTPYYYYNVFIFGSPSQHIVRFEDSRTVNSLMKLVSDYGLDGSGIWNIMVYSAQIWLVINAQYEIVKKEP